MRGGHERHDVVRLGATTNRGACRRARREENRR
nr:MAG TPA: hypothetical protein [Caudoviricetes sp.]